MEMSQGVGEELLADVEDGFLAHLTCSEHHGDKQDTEETCQDEHYM